MPGVDKECVTHHYACDCREEILQRYIRAKEKFYDSPYGDIESHHEYYTAWEELKKLKY